MGPPYSQFGFQGSSSSKHLHVLFMNVPHPIQNLHLIHFPSSPIIYTSTPLQSIYSSSIIIGLMSSLILLLFLLLCLSLHACTPRPLTQKHTAKCLFHEGDMEKLKILETSGSASTLKEVVIGIEATTSSETDSPPLPLTEGQRRHSRSMLGPAKHNVEETVNPKESENMEDTVEMDYAQPHRKPPIHNEKA